MIVSVTWSEGENVGAQVVFNDDRSVEVSVHDVATISLSQWDDVRRRVINAVNQEELGQIYKGSPLGASFSNGERLVNVNAFVALHMLSPTAGAVPVIEALVGEALASQLGGTIVSDDRPSPGCLYVLPTPPVAELPALAELYRAGRLHRLEFRVMSTGRTPREWATFFVPFHSPAIAVGDVSNDAFDISQRIHSAINALT